MKRKSLRFRIVFAITEILMYAGITGILAGVFLFFGVIGGYEHGTIETMGEFFKNLLITVVVFLASCGSLYIGWNVQSVIDPRPTKKNK